MSEELKRNVMSISSDFTKDLFHVRINYFPKEGDSVEGLSSARINMVVPFAVGKTMTTDELGDEAIKRFDAIKHLL